MEIQYEDNVVVTIQLLIILFAKLVQFHITVMHFNILSIIKFVRGISTCLPLQKMHLVKWVDKCDKF